MTDLYTVDSQGRTLIMTAAVNNCCENLEILLEREGCPINAQEGKVAILVLKMDLNIHELTPINQMIFPINWEPKLIKVLNRNRKNSKK